MKITAKVRPYGRTFILSLFLTISFLFSGCSASSLAVTGTVTAGNGTTATNPTENSNKPTQNPTPQKFYSYMTGLEVSETDANLRPVSFFVENSGKNKFYGIKDAEIVIEAPIKASVTSICALDISYSNRERVGVISDASAHIISMSEAFHPIGMCKSYTAGSFHGDILSADDEKNAKLFFRDTALPDSQNLMSDLSALKKHAEANSIPINQTDKYIPPFAFTDIPTTAGGSSAKSVYIPYFDDLYVSFSYNETRKEYVRYTNSSIDTDYLGDKYYYSNLVILICDTITETTPTKNNVFLDDAAGGEGYIVSQGKYVKITWSRDTNGNLILLDSNKNHVGLSVGKTYIGMLQITQKASLTFGI